MADAWETEYFGQTGVNGNADGDGDGASNLAEFRAGTNPTNGASAFRMLGATITGDDVRVDWSTVGGHSYVVESSAAVESNFVNLSPVISVGGTAEGATNYVNIGGATNASRYYRVRLTP
jgi:hypothetical protein